MLPSLRCARRPPAPWLLLLPLLAFGCERIGYYSITGSSGAGQDDDGPQGSPSSIATGPNAVTRAMVLEGIATCGAALHGEIATSAAAFDSAAATYDSSPTEENLTAARAAWKQTIDLWQQAEVLRVGPAGPTTLPEGQGLRDYVYSWPLVSRCLVEQGLVNQKYDDDNFAQVALVNTRGLAAAEYLLFYEGTDNACSASASINSQGTWAALGADGLAERKRAYAAVTARDVADQTAAISQAWAGSGGFAELLSAAGASGSPFDSDQAGLNAVSDGLFYLEKEVKDLKLGKPLGISDECPEVSCLPDVESQYARVARDHIKNNLIGFQRIYEGCDSAPGAGFDDLLRTLGATELADRMSADLEAAIVAADKLPGADLIAGIERDKAAVEGLHAAVKRVTDQLKTEFVTVLDLDLPQNVEGDND